MIVTPIEVPPASGEALEVAPGILWMRLPLPMALDHVNVYALDDGDGWTLIDTGFDTRRGRAEWQALLGGPLAGKPVTRIILTHHHPDHVGLAGWFVEMGADLWTSRTAYLMARMLVLDEQDRPAPETVAFWRGAGMAPAVLEARLSERPFNFADVVAPLPLGFRRLAAGDVLQAGGRAWDVRVGHGHAPEHLTFWSRDDAVVIGGDQLLPSISPNLGVYATEPLADPVGDWIASCRAFQAHAAQDQLILPGHKRPYTGLPDRLQQMIENHEYALDRLRTHLQVPHTAAECFVPIFGREIEPAAYGLALVEAVGHINHLLATDEIVGDKRSDGAWVWTMREAR